MNGLERVLPKTHENYDRLFYDVREGKYYDRTTDLYLTLREAYSLGLGR
jgi:hypothetical protein